MASYYEKFKSKLNWANVLERTDAVPLDRTSIFGSLSEASEYARGEGKLGGISYVGQIVTVYENDNVTVYKISSDRTLEEIGSKLSSVAVSDFGETSEYLGDENIGKIIYVKNKTYSYTNPEGNTIYSTEQPEDGTEFTTYDAGAYIVVGNALQKLAQSSSTGDIQGDITGLETRVSSLEYILNMGGDDLDPIEE